MKRPILLLVLAIGSTSALAAPSNCGSLENHYGPFDYRTQRDKIKVVEEYHYTPIVEALIRGKSTTSVAADLSYLLATTPNHHRGLVSVMRLAEREKSPHPDKLRYSVDCYFDRAIRFAKDDTVVRVLYAQYLHKQGKAPEALAQLETARTLAADNAFSHYNIGLVYLEIGQAELALAQAHKAKSLGFPRTELADMLRSKGQWKDPEG